MMNIGKKSVSLALAACLACGVALTFAFAEAGEAAAATDYYAPVTATGGDALLGQLHDLMCTTHTYYSSYDDCRDYAEETDPALDGGDGIVEFYTHETITTYLGSTNDPGKWNREHVWPQSLSKEKGSKNAQLWGKEGAGSDLHHIRPSEKEMNGTRGNDYFGEVTNGGAVYSQKLGGGNSKLGGYHAGDVFEPLDNVKGDAARIVLYVYTHYNTYSNVHGTTNGNGRSSYFGTLPITYIISASSEEAAFDLLVEWNKLDPVDSIETTRNEVVYGIQGNRNPFIDHPEYVNAIWGDGTVDPDPNPVNPDPVTPSGSKFTITLDSFTLTDGYGFKTWSAGGVSGTAFIFGGTADYPATSMQFNNKKQESSYLASTTPTGGAIKSVTIKLPAGTKYTSDWRLLTSDAAYGEVTGAPTSGTDHGKKTATVDGVTWTLDGDDTYFAIIYEASEYAGYLDSIVIEYEKTETPDPGTQGGTTDPGTQGGTTDPGTQSGTTDPGTTGGTQEPETSSGGCGGVIGGAGALLAVVVAAAVVLRRRKL